MENYDFQLEDDHLLVREGVQEVRDDDYWEMLRQFNLRFRPGPVPRIILLKF